MTSWTRVDGGIVLGSGDLVLFDDSDWHLVKSYSWWRLPARSGAALAYVRGWVDGARILMHRHILGLAPGEPGPDHVNKNGLDNRRSNLRLASFSHNCANRRHSGGTSGFKGVSRTEYGKWRVRVGNHHIGCFDDELEAAMAYDQAALELWGDDHPCLNLPQSV